MMTKDDFESESMAGELHYRQFTYTCQYVIAGMTEGYPDDAEWIALERVRGETSRRKSWVIVNRGIPNTPSSTNRIYAPKIAGPFKSLEEGKKVYLTMMALRGINPT